MFRSTGVIGNFELRMVFGRVMIDICITAF